MSAKVSSTRVLVAMFLFAALPARPQEAAPSESDQQKILATIGQYAADYIAGLPNFVCRQITEAYDSDKNGKHWHKYDTLNEKLVFSGGREQRTREVTNKKQMRSRPQRVGSFSSEGEFGILLSRVFGEASQAKFAWAGWDTIRGHRVARFDYTIDREHSSMELQGYIKTVVAYRGSVYGDPETGAVWRVTSGTTEIPPEVQINSIATTVEYDQVPIGNRKYLLPLSATVLLTTDHDRNRNDIQFTDYRKFEAESTITFGGEDQKPETQKPPPPQ